MLSLLEQIVEQSDIKKLQLNELPLLAEEMRSLIIGSVAATGGHLAPSLGVIELTIALHYVFDTEKDKIVWDVGHQTYGHKILTGRKDRFASLRQYQGVSGFPKREESVHDAFNTGHSSTSISAALGFALARDIQGQDHHIAAVIGDGALTGGQAFEALNQAGHKGINLLVVLNDNEMSIAENVGALSSYLSRIRSDPFYTRRKRDLEFLLHKVPAIGPGVVKAVERLKDSLKYLLVPGMLFEELGFTYLGPIDGHNIAELTGFLDKAKSLQGPVLLHILTQKGRGYKPAEQDPATFHGVGPFDLETGVLLKKSDKPTYTAVLGNTLIDLAQKDERIVALTAAMPEGTGLTRFSQLFPQRFIDVGIAEANAVTQAAAMSLQGLRPVVAIYSTFLQRAYDQILHDVCLQNAPVVFALDRAGLVGEDGPTHHGAFDYSYLRHIPQMSVMAPKDEEELRQMLYTALRYEGPVALRYPRGQGVGVKLTDRYERLPWGRGEVLTTGQDILLIAVGSMVYPALEVSEILKNWGISATVINARFIKPLDEQLLVDAILRNRNFVTLEENVVAGGFGSAILELLTRRGVTKYNCLNIGLPDAFVTHGATAVLKEALELTPEKMADKITRHFSMRKSTERKVVFYFS
ncbi:MAG: 1-deoxy-D-xylulose-5-phosphate synthase [Clostridia bacterium]|nr:1-deoxy-D-xylulose-5-phosphate synthase [Clostridia bacterium]